jgi:hypothetical protein
VRGAFLVAMFLHSLDARLEKAEGAADPARFAKRICGLGAGQEVCV